MDANDLRNFLKFTTGGSPCVANKITINFNSLTGLARHCYYYCYTCSNVLLLELPAPTITIMIFQQNGQLFYDTSNNWNWQMDSC